MGDMKKTQSQLGGSSREGVKPPGDQVGLRPAPHRRPKGSVEGRAIVCGDLDSANTGARLRASSFLQRDEEKIGCSVESGDAEFAGERVQPEFVDQGVRQHSSQPAINSGFPALVGIVEACAKLDVSERELGSIGEGLVAAESL